MKSIRSSLYYYESVANSSTEVERKAAIGDSAAKLKTIITHIESELEGALRTVPWIDGFVEIISSDNDDD